MQHRRTRRSTAKAAHESIAAARPTSSALGGKCTAKLATLVTEEVHEEFCRLARLEGYPSASDRLRELVVISCRGAEYLSNLHRDRVERLARNLTGSFPQGE